MATFTSYAALLVELKNQLAAFPSSGFLTSEVNHTIPGGSTRDVKFRSLTELLDQIARVEQVAAVEATLASGRPCRKTYARPVAPY